MSDSKNGTASKKRHYVDELFTSNKLHTVKEQGNIPSKLRRTSAEDLELQGFLIGRELGEGSYCKVKSATYKGKEIAVKVICKEELSIDFESKFLPREIDVLSMVNHRNLVHIYKIFSYPKRVYIFMELIQRGDMLHFIRERGRLMEGEACFYFRQMVSALSYLHKLNVAHRDIKCENIMISYKDEIKLIDFGFCRSTVDKTGRRELSRTFCGSTAYAAPEVLQGIAYNPMMYDVWSLGCVLFIMVTGTMPFDDSNVRKMVTYQLKRYIRYPTTFKVSKSAKNMISLMLEPDVTRRSNMNQVAHSKWIQEKKDDYQPAKGNELRRDMESISTQPLLKNVIPNNSVSRGTQTMSLNASDEFDIFERLEQGRTKSARK